MISTETFGLSKNYYAQPVNFKGSLYSSLELIPKWITYHLSWKLSSFYECGNVLNEFAKVFSHDSVNHCTKRHFFDLSNFMKSKDYRLPAGFRNILKMDHFFSSLFEQTDYIKYFPRKCTPSNSQRNWTSLTFDLLNNYSALFHGRVASVKENLHSSLS